MIVKITQGKLRGTLRKSVLTGEEFCCFLGIPYAKPPVGKLRFQSPVPSEKWSHDIYDATQEASPCVQFDRMTQEIIGSEDCLYLNVYTPKPPASITIPKAVLVFFHGGGFVHGTASSKSYSPDYLINHDVIVVAVAYRLHALGFFNVGALNQSGNCGLKDQLLALKWVRENIFQFGGDNTNVTIFGESAGASSVHFHMLSPLSNGLFDKAVLQSGTASCPWSFNENPKDHGFLLGENLGFTGNDPEKLVEFLRDQSAADICKAVLAVFAELKLAISGRIDYLCFVPSVEVEKNTELAFLPDHPSVLMKKARPVPLIVGLNNKEGRLAFPDIFEIRIESLHELLPSILSHAMKNESIQSPHVYEQVRKFYFGDKAVGNDTKDEIVDLYTDIFFKDFYDSFDYITASKKYPVYVYEFVFHGKFNYYTKIFMRDPSIKSGASHGDDLPYLFFRDKYVESLKFAEPEVTVIKNMCTLWTNFAKTGNPSSSGIDFKWKQHTSEAPCYAQIDEDLKLCDGKVLNERTEFWNNLLKNAQS